MIRVPRALQIPAILMLPLLFTGAAPPELSRLAGHVHDALQVVRRDAGSPPLERDVILDGVALEIARDVARREAGARLSGRLRARERAERAGVRRLGRLEARVFLMRGNPAPVDEVLRQWRVGGDAWAMLLDEATTRLGLGATRTDDRWLVVVALLGVDVAPRDEPPSHTRLSEKEARLVEARVQSLVLDERRSRGLPALVRDESLDEVARRHSRDMAHRAQLGHQGSDGSDVAARVERRGVAYRRVAENVARVRSRDPAARAMTSWLDSPGHRSNLLDRAVTHTGVGAASTMDGTVYLTQVFIQAPRGR